MRAPKTVSARAMTWIAAWCVSFAACSAPPGADAGSDAGGSGPDAGDDAPPRCGDGRVDPGESCDDGNDAGGDGCRADCTPEVCGDSILDPGESCDDGNTESGDGCRADCTSERCGDGVVDPGETCDDGNTADADGCRADCAGLEVCGDGLLGWWGEIGLAARGDRFHALFPFNDPADDYRDELRYVTGTSSAGSPEVLDTEFAPEVALVLDASGVLHAANLRDAIEVVYGSRPPGGRWSWEVVGLGSYDLALAVDAAGRPHLVYATLSGAELVYRARCP